MTDEQALQFVDSNVFVYLHDRTAGAKSARAKELCSGLWKSRHGCLSIQVPQEFYVNVTQKVPKPIPHAEARRLVTGIGAWRTHRPALEDVLAAIDLQRRHTVFVLGCDDPAQRRRAWQPDPLVRGLESGPELQRHQSSQSDLICQLARIGASLCSDWLRDVRRGK